MLHELKPQHKNRGKKRIGRGGKRGTTSGRGQKGQKSRAGHKIRPAFRDTLIRIPKLRGFRNRPLTKKPKVLDVSALTKLQGAILSPETLKEAHIIPKNHKGRIKILGKGPIEKPVEVQGILVSKSAREAIERAGGKINE